MGKVKSLFQDVVGWGPRVAMHRKALDTLRLEFGYVREGIMTLRVPLISASL